MSQYTKEQIESKQAEISNRKLPVKIEGLESAFDLAQVIKHFMIDRKRTHYKSNSSNQCDANRSRSVEDLTHTANSYGIKISFEQAEKVVMQLISANILTRSFCSTVQRQVHNPRNLTITAEKIRELLGKLSLKNPDYVKPKRKATANSPKN